MEKSARRAGKAVPRAANLGVAGVTRWSAGESEGVVERAVEVNGELRAVVRARQMMPLIVQQTDVSAHAVEVGWITRSASSAEKEGDRSVWIALHRPTRPV